MSITIGHILFEELEIIKKFGVVVLGKKVKELLQVTFFSNFKNYTCLIFGHGKKYNSRILIVGYFNSISKPEFQNLIA